MSSEHRSLKEGTTLLLVALLLSNSAALEAQAPVEVPVFVGSTSRSIAEFEQCFMSVQASQSMPVWFVLHENGGRFSNEGAAGVSNPYRIRFTERRGRSEVKVFLASPDGSQGRLLDTVRSCS